MFDQFFSSSSLTIIFKTFDAVTFIQVMVRIKIYENIHQYCSNICYRITVVVRVLTSRSRRRHQRPVATFMPSSAPSWRRIPAVAVSACRHVPAVVIVADLTPRFWRHRPDVTASISSPLSSSSSPFWRHVSDWPDCDLPTAQRERVTSSEIGRRFVGARTLALVACSLYEVRSMRRKHPWSKHRVFFRDPVMLQVSEPTSKI